MHSISRLLLLLGLIISSNLHAIQFKQIDTEDGLAHPAVLAITQDSLGRIWFGTENGLSLYDGNKVSSYKPFHLLNDSVMFRGNVVREFACNESGDLFFRTGRELMRYDIRLDKFQKITEQSISAIHAYQGEVYIIASHKLYRWESQSKELHFVAKIGVDKVNSFLIDRQGVMWITAEDGLYCLDKEYHATHLKKGVRMASLLESRLGDIWAGGSDGLTRIETDGRVTLFNPTSDYEKGLESNNVRQLAEDALGNIWFGTFRGLYKYDLENDRFLCFSRDGYKGSLSHSSVYAVHIDKGGVLWCGTYFGGVNYANIGERDFTYYAASNKKDELSHPVVGEMVEDRAGNIWICTEGGGLNLLNKKSRLIERFESTAYPYFLPHTNLKSILYNPKAQQLYIGTNQGGFYRYDIHSQTFVQITPESTSINSANVISSMVQVEGDLLLATSQGLVRYNMERGTNTPLLSWGNRRTPQIFINNKGELWCVSQTITCYDLDSMQEVRSFHLRDQGIESSVIRIVETSDGNVYLCTYGGGILRLNRESQRFEAFIRNPKLAQNLYYGMAETKLGNLVATSDNGIFIINKEGEIIHSLEIGKRLPIGSFTRDCGLLVSHQGTIYAGGTNGLVAFEESDNNSLGENHTPYFSELYINSQRVEVNDSSHILTHALPFTEEIRLEHDQNKVEVHFASRTHPSFFDQSVFEYRLVGMDNRWYQANSYSIGYTNLPSGKYQLELRKRLLNGEKEEDAISLSVVVLPPWWATWWARTLWCMLALMAIAYLLLTLRNRRKQALALQRKELERMKLKEMNEAKLRFFTSVSHEFRTPLTLILSQIDLISKGHKFPPTIYNRLMKVKRQSQQLNSLITELIEFRKYEQDQVMLKISRNNINSYLREIFDEFKELSLQKGILFKFKPCEEEVELYFDSYQMRKVFYNLLSNAYKFTSRGGDIEINTRLEKDFNRLQIHIIDSGTGLDEKDIPFVFDRFYQAENISSEKSSLGSGIGLALVKDIVEKHHGTIALKSKLGYGSIFTITLPLGYNQFDTDKFQFVEEGEAVASESEEPLILEEMEEKPHAPEVTEKPLLNKEGKQPVVLIAEDNTELREILISIFTPLYCVIDTPNGAEALEKVKSHRPDLVVSDILMPILSGTELCSRIKNDIDLCHIPVVLLTALDMPQENIEGLLLGADDYITKPFNSRLLLARCNNIIRSRKILLSQRNAEIETDVSLLATNTQERHFLEKITKIIESNISNTDFNIDLLAGEVNMSRTSFYNKFKELTGDTPNEFVNAHKLRIAASWLRKEKKKSVTEISEMLGFSSPNYFCRKFKEQFNLSPAQYRKQNSGGEASVQEEPLLEESETDKN